MTPLMKCGHSGNATQTLVDGSRVPCCVICMCNEEAVTQPDLEGRKAKCHYKSPGRYGDRDYPGAHGEGVKSRLSLPFFEHKPKQEFDTFFCGCWGWD